MEIKERIEQFLDENADKNKAKFDEGLITTKYEIRGIVTKKLMDFAKQLSKEVDSINDFPLENHEEILIAGIVLAISKKITEKDKIKSLKKLLPYIDNWATCDMIVARLKKLENQKDFFVQLLRSNEPFYIRFGIVWFMKFELKKDPRAVVNLLNDNVNNTNYYVEMALAWCYAEALIIDYQYMIEFTQRLKRYVVRNRTLQKACESSRVSQQQKKEIRKLRSKLLGMEI